MTGPSTGIRKALIGRVVGIFESLAVDAGAA